MSNSSPGLTDPCPCGSGRPYKRCCFRKRNKSGGSPGEDTDTAGKRKPPGRSRKRSKPTKSKDRPKPGGSRSSYDSPPPAVGYDFSGPPASVRRFQETLDDAYWAHNEAYAAATGPLTQLISDVNALVSSIPEGYRTILQLYAVFGDDSIGGSRRELENFIKLNVGRDAFRRYKTYREDATLLVFERDDPNAPLRPYRGFDEAPVSVDHELGDWDIEFEPGLRAGWLIELEHSTLLYGPTRLNEAREERFRRAADRAAWGDTPESFRRLDFEADLLLLLLDEQCEELKEDEAAEGRVFRNRYASRPSIPDPDAALDMAKVLFDEVVPVGTDDEGIERYWHVALTLADDVERLAPFRERVERERKQVTKYIQLGDYRHESTETREAEFNADEFLAWLGISPAGDIELPPARDWRSHPVESLELEPAFKRRHELRDDWPLKFARKRLKEREGAGAEAVDTFEAALRLHRRRLRWLTLMDRWRGEAVETKSTFYGLPFAPELLDLNAGLSEFFGDSLYTTPIAELPEESGRFRARLEREFRKQSDAPDVLRIQHIPATAQALASIPGIGGTTVERYIESLEALLGDWEPGEAAPVPSSREAAESDESRRKIDQGLDALDDLFD